MEQLIIDMYKRKIEAYKKICKFANVPELLIIHPELILSEPLTEKDVDWAKQIIENRR
mgnify:CR=1 FL=1